MLFSNLVVLAAASCATRAGHPGSYSLSELTLQHSFAIRRLTTFGALVTAGCALACYQDKPPQSAKGSQTTATTRSADSGAQLGLQPIPATHDTALREIDTFALTSQRLQQWTVAKHGLDALHSTNPEIEERMKAETPPKTVDEAGKRFEAEPKMHEAFQKAGISGKDFLLTSIALQQAMKGFQLKSLGKLDASKVPPVIMQNINFVGSHMPELLGAVAGGPQRRPAP
ncbi:MAG: hypothetical protein ABI889_09265 [Gemmatimonadota bacterium]